MHKTGFLHRDIKPQNILLGREEPHAQKIFLVDFGLANQYLTDEGAHIPKAKYNSVVGTAIFASVNAHNGKELARRDDLESLVYTLLYLFKGNLPWRNL